MAYINGRSYPSRLPQMKNGHTLQICPHGYEYNRNLPHRCPSCACAQPLMVQPLMVQPVVMVRQPVVMVRPILVNNGYYGYSSIPPAPYGNPFF